LAADLTIDIGPRTGGLRGSGSADRCQTARRPFNLRIALLWGAVFVQGASALVFTYALWSEVLGLRSFQIPWDIIEMIQMLASIGLVLGFVTTTLFLKSSMRRLRTMRRQIDVATGNFESHIDEVFASWDLSPSEEAVAVYAMKGFSNAEIADLRGTTASTVKSQMNAIFRKSGLTNRQQLISFLVEEMMSGVAHNSARTAA